MGENSVCVGQCTNAPRPPDWVFAAVVAYALGVGILIGYAIGG